VGGVGGGGTMEVEQACMVRGAGKQAV